MAHGKALDSIDIYKLTNWQRAVVKIPIAQRVRNPRTPSSPSARHHLRPGMPTSRSLNSVNAGPLDTFYDRIRGDDVFSKLAMG
jgi:hypothetical protein